MALTKDKAVEFLSILEGYHERLKMIHWSTTCKAEHLLTDDIDDDVLEYEDNVAENVMGILDDRISDGLKSLLPESNDLKNVLKEMQSDVIDFKKNFEDEDNYAGLVNCCDDFLENVNKWKYLATFS